MTATRYVGSWPVRAATALLALTSVGLWMADTGGSSVFYGAVGSTVLTMVGVIHSSASVFKRWMRFAEGLQTVVVTTIFGVCYLVVVPVFSVIVWFRDPLRLKRRSQQTAWVTRRDDSDPLSLERMG